MVMATARSSGDGGRGQDKENLTWHVLSAICPVRARELAECSERGYDVLGHLIELKSGSGTHNCPKTCTTCLSQRPATGGLPL